MGGAGFIQNKFLMVRFIRKLGRKEPYKFIWGIDSFVGKSCEMRLGKQPSEPLVGV